MKTSIKTIFATSLAALVITTSSTVYAVGTLPATKTIASSAVDISSIQKIVVSGNVVVTLVQNSKSKVLYDNDNAGKVSVKKINNTLAIESENSDKTAEITVYVDNIYRISVSGNAVVQTKETLKLKDLQVFLKDNAYANINSETGSLYTVINDNAELKLQGHSESHVLAMDKLSKITLANFSATKTEKSNTNLTTYAAVKN